MPLRTLAIVYRAQRCIPFLSPGWPKKAPTELSKYNIQSYDNLPMGLYCLVKKALKKQCNIISLYQMYDLLRDVSYCA